MKYSVTIDRVEVKSMTFDIESDDEDTATELAYQKAYDFNFNTLSNSNVEYEVVDVATLN